MRLFLVPILVNEEGLVRDQLFLITNTSVQADGTLTGHQAIEVWPNPNEPAMWIVDDQFTFIRGDRLGGPMREVGIVGNVIVSVTDQEAMRRASEVL